MHPLTLLHAFPFDARMFAAQKKHLAMPIHLMTPNLHGFGGQTTQDSITVYDMADLVARHLDTQNVAKTVIGGVSMGGYVSFAFANRYPDRVAGLVLIDTRADGDDEVAKANRIKQLDLVKSQGVPALVESMLPKLLGPTTTATKPEVVACTREIAAQQSASGVNAAIKMLRDRPDWSQRLHEFPFPTLIIVGEEDVITPPKISQTMHHGIKNSKLVVIPKAGHLSNMESPLEFNTSVEAFMKSLK